MAAAAAAAAAGGWMQVLVSGVRAQGLLPATQPARRVPVHRTRRRRGLVARSRHRRRAAAVARRPPAQTTAAQLLHDRRRLPAVAARQRPCTGDVPEMLTPGRHLSIGRPSDCTRTRPAEKQAAGSDSLRQQSPTMIC